MAAVRAGLAEPRHCHHNTGEWRRPPNGWWPRISIIAPGSLPGACFGPASGWTHGNGLTTDVDYGQDYRITDIDVADMNEIMSLTYRYNDVSNITRMLDNLGVNDQDFQYDALNRLTFASGTYGDIDYTYDGVGNRLSRTIEGDSATTNETYRYEPGSHRIERVTTSDDTGTDTRQLAHDNNGNIVNDVSGEHELKMNVNARNRLAEVRKDGERVGEYQYNALGQRVAKTSRYRGRLHAHFDQGNKGQDNKPQGSKSVIPTPSTALRAGSVEGSRPGRDRSTTNLHSHYDNKPVTDRLHFHYDQQGNLIAETDNQGNIVREYIYLGNYRIAMMTTSLDKPSVIPDARPRDPGSQRRHTRATGQPLALYFIHNDHLGTPQKVTDAEQRIIWSMEQTPFGEVELTTEAIHMPMRFPGQYADIESGFSYNYFRDYDPSNGRYLQPDPIGIRGGIARYTYVGGDPIRHTDMLGLVRWTGNVVTVGASLGGGAIYYEFDLISECVNNRRVRATVVAGGPIIGAGIEISLTSGKIEFFDSNLIPDASVFEGSAKFGTASAVAGGGPGIGAVQLGEAFSVGSSTSGGIDLGASFGAGWSRVVESEVLGPN